jgi:hypothetical protein
MCFVKHAFPFISFTFCSLQSFVVLLKHSFPFLSYSLCSLRLFLSFLVPFLSFNFCRRSLFLSYFKKIFPYLSFSFLVFLKKSSPSFLLLSAGGVCCCLSEICLSFLLLKLFIEVALNLKIPPYFDFLHQLQTVPTSYYT